MAKRIEDSPTGKARHPHDQTRPESPGVKKALLIEDPEKRASALSAALTVRQRAFCHEYVVDFRQELAFIRAGYSPNFADRAASNLMKNRGVRTYIDYLALSKEAKAVAVTPDYVLGQITSVISKENVRDGDKLRALELLARHLGMLTDKTETKVTIDQEQKQRTEEDALSFTETLKRLGQRSDSEKVDIDLV